MKLLSSFSRAPTWLVQLIVILLALDHTKLPVLAARKGQSTLVLARNASILKTHSQFLASLTAAGAQLDVRRSGNSTLQLQHWDTWLYSNIILLHPNVTELGGAADIGQLLEFVEKGGNLLLAVDSTASETTRELASELGVDIEPSGNSVVDHFDHWTGDASHHTVLASSFLPSKALWGSSAPQAPVIFNGIGMSVSPDSSMAKLALWAGPSSYSATAAPLPQDHVSLAGQQVGLAAIVQTRSAARVAVIGSLDALSDDVYSRRISATSGEVQAGNADFGASIAAWLLHQRGLLRFGEFQHHRVGELHPPQAYTIKDNLHFEVQIEELVDSEWQPYRASDVQLDFTMLDPHVRVFLQHDQQGIFSTEFQVPDVYGVFKYVIDYAAPAYNAISLSKQIPVRPFKHTEFERFLSPAYPYYASGVTTMLAFLVLTVVCLYS